MVKAERNGASVVRFVLNYFLISAPISVLGMSFGDAVYRMWKYGHIDPQKLHRLFHLVYEL